MFTWAQSLSLVSSLLSFRISILLPLSLFIAISQAAPFLRGPLSPPSFSPLLMMKITLLTSHQGSSLLVQSHLLVSLSLCGSFTELTKQNTRVVHGWNSSISFYHTSGGWKPQHQIPMGLLVLLLCYFIQLQIAALLLLPDMLLAWCTYDCFLSNFLY